MKRVNIYEAKTHLSKLVSEVEEDGIEIVVCRGGRPVADLGPHRKSAKQLKPNPALKGAKFKGDPCAPVPPEDWPDSLR
jgi:prevent-host-death family protein